MMCIEGVVKEIESFIVLLFSAVGLLLPYAAL